MDGNHTCCCLLSGLKRFRPRPQYLLVGYSVRQINRYLRTALAYSKLLGDFLGEGFEMVLASLLSLAPANLPRFALLFLLFFDVLRLISYFFFIVLRKKYKPNTQNEKYYCVELKPLHTLPHAVRPITKKR